MSLAANLSNSPVVGPAARLWLGAREYFRYHGALTPGVRLMRNVSVLAKVVVVSCTFVSPLALVSWYFYQSQYAEVRAVEAQRQGVRLVAASLDLQEAVQDARRALLPAQDPSAHTAFGTDALHQPLAELNRQFAVLSELASGPQTPAQAQEAHAALAALHHTQTTDANPRSESSMAGWTAYSEALQNLQQYALDQMGNSLESGGREYGLMRLAMVRLPEISGQLFDLELGIEALKSSSPAPYAPQRLAPLWIKLGVVKRDWALAQHNIRRLLELDPGYAAQLQVPSASAPITAFIGQLEQMLSTNLDSPLHADFARQGAQAVAQAWSLQHTCSSLFDATLSERAERIRDQFATVAWWVAAALTLAIYLLVSMLHVMRGGLHVLRSQVERMARGDLSAPPIARGRDEVADALSALRESLGRLATLFTAVRQNVRGVSHAANKIADGNNNLAERTEEAAAAIEEIHVSMENFSSNLDRCGELLNETLPHVHAMRGNTARSKKSMGKMQERMAVLQTKSRAITEIVDLIEGIASQTNILALNASVEAARVGEAGKGFAVVANEVRALALRSAAAADQINTIVTASIEEIEQTHTLADHMAGTVQATDACAVTIDAGMGEIVELMRQGQHSAKEVALALNQVRDVTESNATLVEQLSSAASSLGEQGARLNDEVSVFKLT